MKSAPILLAAFVFAAGTAFAQTPDAPTKQPTPQQQKLGDCAKQAHAKDLKGADYKNFMSTCASNSAPAPAAAKPATPQERMKACNADPKAKTLTGDARKAFMHSCLKGDGAAAATP